MCYDIEPLEVGVQHEGYEHLLRNFRVSSVDTRESLALARDSTGLLYRLTFENSHVKTDSGLKYF